MTKTLKSSNPTPKRKYALAFDPSEGMTEQSHKAECDINNIMARYTKTGTLDHVRRYEGQYLDLPPDDFQEAQQKVADAKSMFEELPSQLRSHFGNDTMKFLDFCVSTRDPAGVLEDIAENYRKQALGIAAESGDDSQKSGKDAAPGEGGKNPPGKEDSSPQPEEGS
jgi:phage internal scaffolding protein